MKAATLLEKLRDLHLQPSYSRPRVSDDNAQVEAFFRTLKYRPGYPRRGFSYLKAARLWVMHFVRWYIKLVAQKMREMLVPVVGSDAATKMCGTVHTFQGKEADFVIFLLGGDPNRPGVISSFAGRKPNLVNVAVTRAKKRLYVVGNRNFWCGANDSRGYYQTMSKLL